jgi:hypothetical protein
VWVGFPGLISAIGRQTGNWTPVAQKTDQVAGTFTWRTVASPRSFFKVGSRKDITLTARANGGVDKHQGRKSCPEPRICWGGGLCRKYWRPLKTSFTLRISDHPKKSDYPMKFKHRGLRDRVPGEINYTVVFLDAYRRSETSRRRRFIFCFAVLIAGHQRICEVCVAVLQYLRAVVIIYSHKLSKYDKSELYCDCEGKQYRHYLELCAF